MAEAPSRAYFTYFLRLCNELLVYVISVHFMLSLFRLGLMHWNLLQITLGLLLLLLLLHLFIEHTTLLRRFISSSNQRCRESLPRLGHLART